MAQNRYIKGWKFITPGIIVLVVTTLAPLITVFVYSLHNVFLYSYQNQTFVGLRNYIRFINDPVFLNSLKVTMVFTVNVTFFSVLFGLLIAMVLNRKGIRGRNVFMTIFLLPFIITPVVIGIIWTFFVWQPDYGLVNHVLRSFGTRGPAWLNNSDTAMFSVVVTNVWKLTPLALVTLYASLTTVPDELIEQSAIDGAGRLTVFRHITFPFIKGQIIFISLVIMTSAYREFDTVISLTGGGPGRVTSVFSLMVYRESILNKNIGNGSALAVLMFLFISVISWVYLKITSSKDIM